MPGPESSIPASRDVPAGSRAGHPNGQAGHPNGQAGHPNGQAVYTNGQAGHPNGQRQPAGRAVPVHDRCVAIVGGGYAGLALAAHLVTSGRSVFLVEADPGRRDALIRGEIPIYEPGLDSVLTRAAGEAALHVTGDLRRALGATRMAFITVGTPSAEDHHPDLSAVNSVIS